MTSNKRQSRIESIALIGLAALVSFIILATIADFALTREVSRAGVDGLIDLAKALIWPVTLISMITLFEIPIREFLSRLSKLIFKVGDNEVTLEATEKIADASFNLGAATATAKGATSESRTAEKVTNSDRLSGAILSRVISQAILSERSLAGRVLWVDDRPENNRYLIRAFEALRISVILAKSTDDALLCLDVGNYDVIITDMGRPPDSQAGYTLLGELQRRGIRTQVIVYAGSDSEEHKRLAQAAGALDSTNRPQRVFDLVTDIIIGKQAIPA